MNDKIKELALKSMDSYPSFDNVARGQYSNSQYNSAIEQMMTTFAELIVKECANLCDKDYERCGQDGAGWRLARMIEEHFGIE